uniref:C-type lectin domain-containing protein n=1 Tax=Steinernema glaseri TaxID=37863 RepID=A0A1I7YIZ8_9BILA
MIRLTLFSLLLIVVAADEGCPPGASLSLNGDKCFHPAPTSADFYTAEALCVSFGGHLASVHNKWDNAALFAYSHLNDYWLGGQNVNSSGSWTWTDGSPFNYNIWEAEEDTAGQECLLVDRRTAQWQRYDCKRSANFICETPTWKPSPTSTTTSVPTTTTAPPCSGNTTCVGNQCYVFVGCPLAWDDALNNCKRMNGNLASVHSGPVEQVIEQQRASQGWWYWLGGQLDDKRYLSWSDGTSVNYLNWLPQHPIHVSNYRCVGVETGGWLNYDCQYPLRSVCVIT